MVVTADTCPLQFGAKTPVGMCCSAHSLLRAIVEDKDLFGWSCTTVCNEEVQVSQILPAADNRMSCIYYVGPIAAEFDRDHVVVHVKTLDDGLLDVWWLRTRESLKWHRGTKLQSKVSYFSIRRAESRYAVQILSK